MAGFRQFVERKRGSGDLGVNSEKSGACGWLEHELSGDEFARRRSEESQGRAAWRIAGTGRFPPNAAYAREAGQRKPFQHGKITGR